MEVDKMNELYNSATQIEYRADAFIKGLQFVVVGGIFLMAGLKLLEYSVSDIQ